MTRGRLCQGRRLLCSLPIFSLDPSLLPGKTMEGAVHHGLDGKIRPAAAWIFFLIPT